MPQFSGALKRQLEQSAQAQVTQRRGHAFEFFRIFAGTLALGVLPLCNFEDRSQCGGIGRREGRLDTAFGPEPTAGFLKRWNARLFTRHP